jgi:hypothetical protein
MHYFNSKIEALEWINFILDKYAARYTSFIGPNHENKDGGHFFKVSLDSNNILIDAVYGKGTVDLPGHNIGGERSWQYILPFSNLKIISLVFKEKVFPLVHIKFHTKWFKNFTKKNLNEINKLNPLYSYESYVEIILLDSVVNDNNFNENKLNEAFNLLTS